MKYRYLQYLGTLKLNNSWKRSLNLSPTQQNLFENHIQNRMKPINSTFKKMKLDISKYHLNTVLPTINMGDIRSEIKKFNLLFESTKTNNEKQNSIEYKSSHNVLDDSYHKEVLDDSSYQKLSRRDISSNSYF